MSGNARRPEQERPMLVIPGLPFVPGDGASMACFTRYTHGQCTGKVDTAVSGERRVLDCTCNCHLERGRYGDR